MLESNLTTLEKKIDDLLASFKESERLKVAEGNSKVPTPRSGGDGSSSSSSSKA